MRFWDSSAIVPLLVHEPATRRMQALAERDPEMLVWWGSQVKCASALSRLERAAALDLKRGALAFDRPTQLATAWQEIEPSDIVRESAIRVLRVHPLRGPTLCNSAQALIAAERRPASLPFVTLDDRLPEAAQKEGSH